MSLKQKGCIPCQGGIPPLPLSEAKKFLNQVSNWQLEGKAKNISKRFDFSNFIKTMDFVNKLGSLAEDEGHHPDICFGWGYANVKFFTHKLDGLHENDFIMAAKTDDLL